MLQVNKIYKGDCLKLMKRIPDGSIDLILCDLPYGMTSCDWDTIIPIKPLWGQYSRIIKDHCAIVLFGSQPFTSLLVTSNSTMFRHEWVWEKPQGTNFLMAKHQPLKVHEDVLVFSRKAPRYFPQMTTGQPYKSRSGTKRSEIYGHVIKTGSTNLGTRYPKSILKVKRDRGLHPTQKPVELIEYLIKTYTAQGDLVLDNCAGSGTTGIACIKTQRKYILIEKESRYISVIRKRIQKYTFLSL